MRAFILASVLLLAFPAAAEQGCATYNEAVRFMAAQHREVEIAVAIFDDEDGQEREARLFASRGGRTWTLVAEDAKGCWVIRAFGKDWRPLTGRDH